MEPDWKEGNDDWRSAQSYDEAYGPMDPKQNTRKYQPAVWTEETTFSANIGRMDGANRPTIGHRPNTAFHPNRRPPRP